MWLLGRANACACDYVSTRYSTWRNGHVVLFRVASSDGAHVVQTVGCDDGVGLR